MAVQPGLCRLLKTRKTGFLTTRLIWENNVSDQLCSNHVADQHLCFPYIDNTIPLVLKSEISSIKPSSVAVQPGLCWTCLETSMIGFLMTQLIYWAIKLEHKQIFLISYAVAPLSRLYHRGCRVFCFCGQFFAKKVLFAFM